MSKEPKMALGTQSETGTHYIAPASGAVTGKGLGVSASLGGRGISEGHSRLSGQLFDSHCIAASKRRAPMSDDPLRIAAMRLPPLRIRVEARASEMPLASQ